ncbi:hypothetical protein KJQ75_05865 [Campylobacter lari]|uniref:YopX family protein n=1 Tax=Campylobacter lari TaxID=201 RepID=UPI0012CF1012|nr:YopX family protein [Campylobacter lari]MBT0828359.1 hypothetical protein [Campylobacter lari]
MKLSEFDFRIWDKTKEEFLKKEPTLIKIDNERVIAGRISRFYANTADITDMFIGNGNDLEIELWTGIYDKFGDKIYEGDIVKYCDFENLVIKFVDGVFIASRSYNEFIKKIKHGYNEEEVKNTLFKSSYKLYKQVFDEKMCDNLKIIGNIHENPEFLKC